MTVRQLLVTVAVASVCVASAFAQQPMAIPPPQPTPPAAPAKQPEERRAGQPVNIKVDVTITDQHGGTTGLKKTVSVVAADTMSGRIRSTASYSGIGDVPLNVDTDATLLAEGKIRLHVDLQYDLPGTPTNVEQNAVAGSLRRTALRENLVVIVDNGKPLIAAQSADPVGDRQVTIELKASVLR